MCSKGSPCGGQEGRPRRGRKVRSPPAKQEEPGERWGQRERRGRQEGLHPLPAGVLDPPCSEQQAETSGAWEREDLAAVLGMPPRWTGQLGGGQAGLPGMSSERGWVSGLQQAALQQ